MTKKRLFQLGELGLLKMIRSKCATFSKALVGVGDDAAVLSWEGQNYLVLTTDCFVENVHFNLAWASFKEVGYKTLAATLSDLAAMAAKPVGFLVSLGLPSYYEVESVERVYEGFFDLASKFEVELVGGDLVSSPVFFLSLTAFGSVEKELLRTRSEAQAGELVMVTGNPGYSALGLKALEKGITFDSDDFLVFEPFIIAHLKPEPKIREARLFSRLGARAMEDISDGLASEVMHIAEESGVGIEVFADKLPLSEPFLEASKKIKADVRSLILFGGEDFELVFTVPQEKVSSLLFQSQKAGLKIAEIGRVVEERGVWIFKEGKKEALKPGYQHFKN